MKHLAISLLISSALFASCNSGDNANKVDSKDSTSTTTTTATTPDSAHRDTSSSMSSTTTSANNSAPADTRTVEFVNKAASGGMMEVQLGQLAQQKAKSQRVKDFGSMMNTDHTNANNELKALATSKNIQIPATLSPKDQKHIDEMGKMSGAAFDKMYMNMMVNDHKEDISDFKKASTDLKDADVKAFASKTLPVLEKHLDSANAIHHKM